MRILAIETSCDETGVALLECSGSFKDASFTILGNSLDSQADKHAAYGGVYPTLAKREHQTNLGPLTAEVLRQAGILKEETAPISVPENALAGIRDEQFKEDVKKFLSFFEKPNIDLIAVTHGPGLEPALWTGINFADALSKAWGIPILGIDHMEGHILSALLSKKGVAQENQYVLAPITFPLLSLLISGGHTELVAMHDWFVYERIGKTKDDAVGEAFDKVARLLDFPYPGGPHIQKAAARSRARGGTAITFPRPLKHDPSCDFSFSGLKTAVLYKLRQMEEISEEDKEAVAQAFEDAARDSLVSKTWQALEKTNAKTLAVGGGVSANEEIRQALASLLAQNFSDTLLCTPEPGLTGDNAIMIGAAAYMRHLSGKESDAELSALGALVLE